MNIVVERKYQVLKLNQYSLLHTNIYCWILQQTANHKNSRIRLQYEVCGQGDPQRKICGFESNRINVDRAVILTQAKQLITLLKYKSALKLDSEIE